MSDNNIELTEQDRIDLAKLEEMPETPTEVAYHPVLAVWREVLSNAEHELDSPVTPAWASRIVQSYPEITFADMVSFRDLMFGRIIELREILDAEIASDEDCLSYGSPEEDRAENREHYLNVIRDWQGQILRWELVWDCLSPAAGVDMGTIAEVQKMFFGGTGIVPYLDAIGFQFGEADQAAVAAALEEIKAEVTGE